MKHKTYSGVPGQQDLSGTRREDSPATYQGSRHEIRIVEGRRTVQAAQEFVCVFLLEFGVWRCGFNFRTGNRFFIFIYVSNLSINIIYLKTIKFIFLIHEQQLHPQFNAAAEVNSTLATSPQSRHKQNQCFSRIQFPKKNVFRHITL